MSYILDIRVSVSMFESCMMFGRNLCFIASNHKQPGVMNSLIVTIILSDVFGGFMLK